MANVAMARASTDERVFFTAVLPKVMVIQTNDIQDRGVAERRTASALLAPVPSSLRAIVFLGLSYVGHFSRQTCKIMASTQKRESESSLLSGTRTSNSLPPRELRFVRI
jgi:hypothetical protein